MYRSFFSSSLLSSAKPVTKRHVEQRLLAVPAAHLLSIVEDVNRYSEFLPLCSHSAILLESSSSDKPNSNQTTPEETMREFQATLTVGFMPPLLTETYTSQVQVFPRQYRIHTKSIQSKWLDSLESTWQLTPTVNDNMNSSSSSDDRVVSRTTENTTNDNGKYHSLNQPPIKLDHSAEEIYLLGQNPESWCRVHFSMSLQARDPMILQTLDQVLEQVAQQQVNAFYHRCQQIPYRQQ